MDWIRIIIKAMNYYKFRQFFYFLVALILLSSLPCWAQNSETVHEGKVVPGTMPLERPTEGVIITNERKVAVRLKITVNYQDSLVIVIPPNKKFYVYCLAESPQSQNGIYYSYQPGSTNSGSSSKGHALYAYVVLNEGVQNPMGFSGEPFQLSEKQRSTLFYSDFRFTNLTSVDIIEIDQKSTDKATRKQ